MKTPPHGLTTIAAIPRTGGAGMALLGETNTRAPEAGWYINLCKLRLTVQRDREVWNRLYLGHFP